MHYYYEELIDMIYVLGESELFASIQIVCTAIPDRSQPKPETFESIKEWFERTESIEYWKKERIESITGEDNKFMVLAIVVE